jgi:hypothetical protein
MVNSSDELDVEIQRVEEDYKDAEFILDENGKYIVGREVEENVEIEIQRCNADNICAEYARYFCVCTKCFRTFRTSKTLEYRRFQVCLVS